MEEQQLESASYYLIKNNNISPVLNSFQSLCNETVIHDVTLACEDGKMESSRALLALAFPPLQDMLKNREEDFLVLIMPDCIKDEIAQVLTKLMSNTLDNNGKDQNFDISKYDNDAAEGVQCLDIENMEIKPEGNEVLIDNSQLDYLHINNIIEAQECSISDEEINKEEKTDTKAMTIRQSNEEQDIKLICNECGKGFATRWCLKQHTPTHENKVCKVCGKIFIDRYRGHYKKHLESHEKVPKIHKKYKKYIKYSDAYQVLCIFCDFKFSSNANDQFISHIDKHLSDKESEERTLLTFEYYVSELVRLEELLTDGTKSNGILGTQDKYGNFNCDACDFNSKILKEVLSHRNNDHFPGKLTRRREIWDIVRKKQTHLLREMKNRSFIPIDTPLNYSLCKPWNIEVLKKFQPIKELNESLKCDLCDFGTTHTNKLRCHKLTAHKTAKFECDVCGESNFMTFHWVKQHQMEKHNMWGGMVSCGHCEEKFTHEGLKRHTKSINGIKRQFPECHNFYSSVYQHITSVHRGNKHKQYCSVCKRNYGKRKYPIHICSPRTVKLYHNEKTTCGICKETWKIQSAFNLHLQIDHLPNIGKELGLQGDLSTENISLREEIAGIFVVSQFEKSEKANHMICKLCLKTVQDYSNEMVFQMKTHLGFNNMKKVCRPQVYHENIRINEEKIK